MPTVQQLVREASKLKVKEVRAACWLCRLACCRCIGSGGPALGGACCSTARSTDAQHLPP